jgi:predicted transcriptional regulator
MEENRGSLVGLRSAPMRSRIEIMANILDEVRSSPGGLRKTRLMYRCNLSFRQLKVYVRVLREKGFLNATVLKCKNKSADGKGGKVEVYRITEDGLLFLKSHNDLKRRLREDYLTR